MTTFVLLPFKKKKKVLPFPHVKRIHGGYVHITTTELDVDRCTPTLVHCCPEVNSDSGETGMSLD